MKRIFRPPLVIGLLLFSLSLQGCVLLLVGGAAAGGAAAASSSSSKDKKKDYETYVASMKKLNTEREQSGLQPKPVKTFEEWAKN